VSLEIGDILLTRHADEEKNTSPGHWNHAAMYVGDNTIVEAQARPDAVLTVDWPTFYHRYAEIAVFRSYYPAEVRNKMGEAARTLLGSLYRKYASIFRWLRSSTKGENCVSTVRKAFKQATGFDPRWKKPDDIYEDPNLWIVYKK